MKQTQLFEPLTDFFEAIADDPKIGVTHISLYISLLQQWNINEGKNPLTIQRSIIMNAAKINSRQTYNKCMRHLHEYGYISYVPSTNQFLSSYVYLKGL